MNPYASPRHECKPTEPFQRWRVLGRASVACVTAYYLWSAVHAVQFLLNPPGNTVVMPGVNAQLMIIAALIFAMAAMGAIVVFLPLQNAKHVFLAHAWAGISVPFSALLAITPIAPHVWYLLPWHGLLMGMAIVAIFSLRRAHAIDTLNATEIHVVQRNTA